MKTGILAKTMRRRIMASAAVAFMVAVLSVGTASFARAQIAGEQLFGGQQAAGSQMLLEADELVYNNDDDTVSAVGNVQIAYEGYNLTAQRVTYSRRSGRVIAQGSVEILEPSGARVYAEEIDVTDDFSDGFVSSLRVETTDNTRFAAESAERRDGEIAVFNNGVYTACEPCRENPEKPPLWQVRANRVIINNRTKRVEYEGASFELFGRPIAYLPRFSHADPSIRRQSGFLFPNISYSEVLGVGVRNSYFWATSQNTDLTLTGTYYSNQGFLTEAEWRHRLANGQYSLRAAGIDQQNPADFQAESIDARETDRYAIMTTGRFEINPRWTTGWRALFQSDRDFAETYGLHEFGSRDVTNEAYLTGLAGKNYFDLRVQKFLIQDYLFDQDSVAAGAQSLQDQQGNALPVMDYNRVSDEAVLGGQVSFDMNVQNIHRHTASIVNNDGLVTQGFSERYQGIAGDWARVSTEAEWKAREIVNGAVVTASLAGRADAIVLNTADPLSVTNPLEENSNLLRGMPSGMLEIRYPLAAQDGYATHIFEPIAQVIARPDETHIGDFPNEDAQSLVFDTTNLFERDKFSGYDRVEGGTRANAGFRYSANFTNGASINLVAGQSFHLAGKNSYAQQDLVNAGLSSGLETARSDYVLSASVDNGHGFGVGLGGRFDERNLSFRRGELGARYSWTRYSLTGSYIFVDPQSRSGFNERRHEVNAGASVKLNDNWRTFASVSYDIEQSNLYQRGIGLAYDDSCFSFSVAYNQAEDRYTGDATETSVIFRVGLRTIGDYDYKYSFDDDGQ